LPAAVLLVGLGALVTGAVLLVMRGRGLAFGGGVPPPQARAWSPSARPAPWCSGWLWRAA
jgi:hypothetical protein